MYVYTYFTIDIMYVMEKRGVDWVQRYSCGPIFYAIDFCEVSPLPLTPTNFLLSQFMSSKIQKY